MYFPLSLTGYATARDWVSEFIGVFVTLTATANTNNPYYNYVCICQFVFRYSKLNTSLPGRCLIRFTQCVRRILASIHQEPLTNIDASFRNRYGRNWADDTRLLPWWSIAIHHVVSRWSCTTIYYARNRSPKLSVLQPVYYAWLSSMRQLKVSSQFPARVCKYNFVTRYESYLFISN